jgi:hypothetical protein
MGCAASGCAGLEVLLQAFERFGLAFALNIKINLASILLGF